MATRRPAAAALAVLLLLLLMAGCRASDGPNNATGSSTQTSMPPTTDRSTATTQRTPDADACSTLSCRLRPTSARLDDGSSVPALLDGEPGSCASSWQPGERIEEAALHAVNVDFGRNVVNATIEISGRSLDVDVSEVGPIVEIQREGGSDQTYYRRDGTFTDENGVQKVAIKLYKNAGVIRDVRIKIGGIQAICALRLDGAPA
jgi:hypothetical protein